MAPFFRAALLLAAAPLISMPDCSGEKPPRRHFDSPQSVTVAPYGEALPPHAYAFVVDDNNRALRTLDLDDHDREQRLPTGRRLSSLVAHTGPSGTADLVWAIDRDSGEVVRFTLADALLPTATAPVFTDVGAPSAVEMSAVTVIPGRTPSSTWTVTWRDGLQRWEVRSAAGVDEKLAKTGDNFTADERAVKFEIRRTDGDAPPTDGDTFTFETYNGLDVVAVSTTGRGVGLVAAGPDTAVLTTSSASLVAFNMVSGLAEQTLALSPGAMPGGMELAPDGTTLWVADLGNPLVYRVDTVGAPAAWTVTAFPVPIPMRDLAVTGDGLRLFTLAADADDVFVFTVPDVRPVDILGITPEVDSLPLRSAIRSIAGARQPHVMKGTGVPAYPVLLTTHAGNVFFLNGSTGCADYSDLRGPRFTGIRFRDSALPSNPSFDLSSFAVTSCGGFIHNENWTLTYNGLLDAWEVQGSVTGKQSGLLTEGVPYTTDRGELSFQILGDVQLPSDDGDQFVFSLTDGISPLQVGLIPDRPAFALVGDDAHEVAVVANAASDSVAQFDVRRRRVTKTYR